MEFKIEVECKFCKGRLDYEITGDLSKGFTVHVAPCERCTDKALDEAWSIVRKSRKAEEE